MRPNPNRPVIQRRTHGEIKPSFKICFHSPLVLHVHPPRLVRELASERVRYRSGGISAPFNRVRFDQMRVRVQKARNEETVFAVYDEFVFLLLLFLSSVISALPPNVQDDAISCIDFDRAPAHESALVCGGQTNITFPFFFVFETFVISSIEKRGRWNSHPSQSHRVRPRLLQILLLVCIIRILLQRQRPPGHQSTRDAFSPFRR